MAVTNSTNNVQMFIHEQIYKVDLDAITGTKIAVVFLMVVFFVYINLIMLFVIRSKSALYETPRYILFGHMLLNDSVQLLVTTVMYVMAFAFLSMTKAICLLLVLISGCTSQNAPLTLALMSLERYVAICFPLRHANIATKKGTVIAIGIIWFLSSLNFVTDIMYEFIIDPNHLVKITFCTRERLFVTKWQADKAQGFDILYFVSVTLIIFSTYISIMVTARSLSSNKDSANKAHKTVLLHFFQLGLCLTSFLYGTIERMLYMMAGSSSSLFIHLRYLNFLIVLILPRCLSPLIYGLRDDAVWPLFRYYFCYTARKVKPTSSLH